MAYDLHYYQKEAWDAIRDRFAAGHRGAVIWLPTGSGKTVITALLAQQISEEPHGRLLVLVGRDFLAEQARDEILEFVPDADIGIYGFGKRALARKIIIGGVQTLSKANHLAIIKSLPFTMINIDETHHVCSPQYRIILNCFPNARMVGQSATPFRSDGLSVYEVFGCDGPTYKKNILELIDQGYLSNLLIAQVKTHVSVGSIASGGKEGDYNEDELEAAINRPDVNTLAAQTCVKEEYGGPTIPTACFTINKKHAIAVEEEMIRHGIKAKAVVDMDDGDWEDIQEAFAKKELHMLITVYKLLEGWDANVWRLVDMAPTKSAGRFLQKIGRGTRRAPGKQFCWLLDFTYDSEDHSFDPLTAADVLGLPELETGGSVEDAIKARQERGEEVPGIDNDDDQQIFMGGEIVVREKPAHQSVAWIPAAYGDFVAQAKDGRVVIFPAGAGKYDIYVGSKINGKMKYTMKEKGKSLGFAQMTAERYYKQMEKGYGWTLQPEHPRYKEPSTPDQIKALKRFGINAQYMSKGKASEILDKCYNGKKKKPAKKKSA